jgi:PPOX class probable F420-dependent enzyme
MTASDPGVAAPLDPAIRAFLDADRFATIATTDPDGAPRQAVIWYTLEGDTLVVNSAVGRRWPANLLRDPRVALAIADETSYRWVGLVGRAQPVEDQAIAQADIAAMARRYHAHEPEEAERLIRERFERQTRISFRIAVHGVHDHRD